MREINNKYFLNTTQNSIPNIKIAYILMIILVVLYVIPFIQLKLSIGVG